MSVYPLELQRKIDRRWFHRSEETVYLRTHPKGLSDFSRESAEDSNTRSPPTPASSAKPPTTLLAS